MLKRTLTVTGVVTVAVLGPVATQSAAWADGWGTVDCSQAPTPQCQLEAGGTGHPSSSPTTPDQHNGGSAGHTGGNLPACAYARSEFGGHPSADGMSWPPSAWYEGTCSLTGEIRNPVLVTQVAPADVAALARAQLGLPKPTVAANPAANQLVNLPTWMWLADGWEVIEATASVPGVSVTATARPTSVSWTTGDGATVTCTGPGTRYTQGVDPRSPSPDCGHTYRHSSAPQPGDAFAVTATVHWSVTWSGAGQSGTFPEMTTTSSTRLRVEESQALNTHPGPR
jgi:hypothetical protein